jgi:hypothetical protein
LAQSPIEPAFSVVVRGGVRLDAQLEVLRMNSLVARQPIRFDQRPRHIPVIGFF